MHPSLKGAPLSFPRLPAGHARSSQESPDASRPEEAMAQRVESGRRGPTRRLSPKARSEKEPEMLKGTEPLRALPVKSADWREPEYVLGRAPVRALYATEKKMRLGRRQRAATSEASCKLGGVHDVKMMLATRKRQQRASYFPIARVLVSSSLRYSRRSFLAHPHLSRRCR